MLSFAGTRPVDKLSKMSIRVDAGLLILTVAFYTEGNATVLHTLCIVSQRTVLS